MAATEGQKFYENKLQEFRKRSVNSDNYENFISDVNNIIAEANSSIEEMRQEVKRKKSHVEKIKNKIGEDNLDSLRKENASGYHYDIREIRELREEIAEVRNRMFERAMVRGDLHDVKNKKIQPILESLDAESVRSDVYEQMNELTEKRIETAEDRIQSKMEALESKVESDYKDLSRQIREIREASRREADSRGSALIEFMEKVIERERSRGGDVEGLVEKKEQVENGERVDDVDVSAPKDLDVSSGSEDEGESGSDRSVSDLSSSSGSGKAEKIKEELRKMQDDDAESEYSSQSELAREFDVTPGRVTQLKKEL